MSTVTLHGNPVEVSGSLPAVGSESTGFHLVSGDLKDVSLHDFAGKKKVLNIFPSVDTATCAMSVRQFNSRAAKLPNTVVLCISADLPFAQKRFCGAEGIENVVNLSLMRGAAFAKDYGVKIETGPLAGLTARAVVVIDENNIVRHTELVGEIAHEPNYDAAIAALDSVDEVTATDGQKETIIRIYREQKGDKEAVISAFAEAENADRVTRSSNVNNESSLQYARKLFSNGDRKNWFKGI